jgi:hypothetical protein
MSKHSIREDKTCSNCFSEVEQRFCPNCGQENIETRQSFKHLFTHFFEDLTHYDNAFWKTIKYLLFKPSKLTTEYLSGKRLYFVPPVRLYLFISFITFLVPSLLPETDQEVSDGKKIEIKEEKKGALKNDNNVKTFSVLGTQKYSSIPEMDSIQKTLPKEQRMGLIQHWLVKNAITLNQKNTKEEIKEKFGESLAHNLPKAIFIYLPIFGFWLWIFHNKKRWIFFDHSIFTLHYVGFLLLTFTIYSVIDYGIFLIPNTDISEIISKLFSFATSIWAFIYFYKAHQKMYGETRLVSNTKSTLLFVINFIFIALILSLLALYTLFHL